MSDHAQDPAHPAHAARVVTCGPENVSEFNAELRRHAPEAFDLARALHAAGMIDGLRGARLAIGGTLPTRGGVRLSEMVIEPRKSEMRKTR